MEGFAMNLPRELAVQYCEMKQRFWADFQRRVEEHYAGATSSGTGEPPVEQPKEVNVEKKKKSPKPHDEEKKKRGASPYNLFIGAKLKQLREENPEMNHKEAFRMAIDMWKTRETTGQAVEDTVDPQDTSLEEVLNPK